MVYGESFKTGRHKKITATLQTCKYKFFWISSSYTILEKWIYWNPSYNPQSAILWSPVLACIALPLLRYWDGPHRPPHILSSPAEVGHTTATATATTQTTSPRGHHSLLVMVYMCLLPIQINTMLKLKLNQCLCCKYFIFATHPPSVNIEWWMMSAPGPSDLYPALVSPLSVSSALFCGLTPATTLPCSWQSSSGMWSWKRTFEKFHREGPCLSEIGSQRS